MALLSRRRTHPRGRVSLLMIVCRSFDRARSTVWLSVGPWRVQSGTRCGHSGRTPPYGLRRRERMVGRSGGELERRMRRVPSDHDGLSAGDELNGFPEVGELGLVDGRDAVAGYAAREDLIEVDQRCLEVGLPADIAPGGGGQLVAVAEGNQPLGPRRDDLGRYLYRAVGRKQPSSCYLVGLFHAYSVEGVNTLTVRPARQFVGKYSNTGGAHASSTWSQRPWAEALWKTSTPAPRPPSASRRMMAGLAKAVQPG